MGSESLCYERSVLVYDSGFALIHEKRKLTQNGESTIMLLDLPDTLDIHSVSISGIDVSSISFVAGKPTPKLLLESYVGSTIHIGNREFDLIACEDKPVFRDKTTGEIVFDPQGEIRLPENASVSVKSGLKLIVEPFTGYKEIDLSYICKKMDWNLFYELSMDGDKAVLQCWTTINNNTGFQFRNCAVSVAFCSEHIKETGVLSDPNDDKMHASIVGASKSEFIYTIPIGRLDSIDPGKSAKTSLFKLNIEKYAQIYRYYAGSGISTIYELDLDTLPEVTGLPLKHKCAIYTHHPELNQRILIGKGYIEHSRNDNKLRIVLNRVIQDYADFKQVRTKTSSGRESITETIYLKSVYTTSRVVALEITLPLNTELISSTIQPIFRDVNLMRFPIRLSNEEFTIIQYTFLV